MKMKLNGMDLVIILILVLAIGAGAVLLSRGSSQQAVAETKRVQLQVELANKEADFAELPREGDTVTIGVKEKMEAVVTKVEVNPAQNVGKDVIDGKATLVEIPNRYDVLITLEGDGVETAEDVRLNGVPARVGAEAVVKSKNWAGVGYFLAVEPR